jgi:lipid II:glycine glycyltransferase (peptidoglycan interpeptide bridge formation enzyme)
VRLFPLLFDDGSGSFESILKEEGFSWLGKEERDRTLLIDLTRQLRDLREGLRPQWRRNLKLAERNGFEVIEGGDDELFEMFSKMYEEMVSRKRFVEPDDFYDFKVIQQRLPKEFKTKIMLCRSGNNLCAGLVCSAIGKTAIYLFGATSNIGIKSRGASHLLHWKLIEWLKKNDVAVYDLHGVNPVSNPGTYRFKNELCGTNGRDVYFLGRFDSYENVVSYSCMKMGDTLRAIHRTMTRIATAGWRLKKEMTSAKNDSLSN